MKIIQSPDPILNTICEECEPGDKSLARIAKQMGRLMYKCHGCGLAAPQVGLNKRLIVVDCEEEYYGEEPLVLVNPVIMERKGNPVKDDEGCLSLPGIHVPIARQPWVRVRYYDLEGELWEIEGDGLLGRCLQHEIDHLDGKTLFESCDTEARVQALMDYEKAVAAGAKPGDTAIED